MSTLNATAAPVREAIWGHQVTAVEFIHSHWLTGRRGVMLAMAMGTGKSLVTIRAAAKMRLSPILILCPLRVVEVWEQQFARFDPSYALLALDDRIPNVTEKLLKAKQFVAWALDRNQGAVVVINYHSAIADPFANWVVNRRWPLVVVDECHKLKKPSGQISRLASRLGLLANYRLGLTGTPIPHDALDLWAQFRFLDRTVYDPTFTSFKARYAVTVGPYNKVIDWRDKEDLHAKFSSIAFQVSSDVLDLPPELDQTYHATLTPTGARTYRSLDRDFMAWLASGEIITVKNALERLLRLHQVTGGTLAGEQVDTSKEILLEDLLEDFAPKEPVVVFCLFKNDLEVVKRVGDRLGRGVAELRGGHSDLKTWQASAEGELPILAVQIQAGDVGIDLTRARYAIYYSLSFNLAEYLQSRARIRRPGQTRAVTYYHLVARHTIDEYIMAALAKRQTLIETILRQYQTRTSTYQGV